MESGGPDDSDEDIGLGEEEPLNAPVPARSVGVIKFGGGTAKAKGVRPTDPDAAKATCHVCGQTGHCAGFIAGGAVYIDCQTAPSALSILILHGPCSSSLKAMVA